MDGVKIVRRLLIPLYLVMLALLPLSASAQEAITLPLSCETGLVLQDGVEVRLPELQSGFTYTATVIGVDDFNPVLALVDADGTVNCVDVAEDAASYAADLPTTGPVSASAANTQIQFTTEGRARRAPVTLFISGEGEEAITHGEFILVLEGLTTNAADSAGDSVLVKVTESIAESEVPVTLYMISVTSVLDPQIQLLDAQENPVLDDDGNAIYCDDAGQEQICWGESIPLVSSYITRRDNQQLRGYGSDAMLSIPLEALSFDFDADAEDANLLRFVFSSYEQASFGDYIVALHMGFGQPQD
jgi:hypothetical protein